MGLERRDGKKQSHRRGVTSTAIAELTGSGSADLLKSSMCDHILHLANPTPGSPSHFGCGLRIIKPGTCAFRTIPHKTILFLTMLRTDASPAKDADRFRLHITMPAFHKNVVCRLTFVRHQLKGCRMTVFHLAGAALRISLK